MSRCTCLYDPSDADGPIEVDITCPYHAPDTIPPPFYPSDNRMWGPVDELWNEPDATDFEIDDIGPFVEDDE